MSVTKSLYTVSAVVHHLEDCVYLPEVCPLGCVSLEGEKKGEVVRMERRHIPGHVKDSCHLREIVREFCEGKVKASEMNEEQNSDKDLQIASLTKTLFTYTQLPQED